MSKRNTIITGIIFLFLGYFVLSSRSSGLAASNSLDGTGSPSSFLTCATCHNGGAFNTTATLQILDGTTPVTSYIPGNNYTMTLQVSGNANFYGGQAVAMTSSNANAGTMGIPTTAETRVTNLGGKFYLEQNTRSSSGTFSVPWTAPASGTGDVSIYFIGNGVNGDFNSSGDEVTAGMSMILSEAILETCSDGIMNQDETDIDCGGTNCIACPTCFDSVQNGDETGIDCGGSCDECIPSLYVDYTATGANDGSSWLNAFTDLNEALEQGTNKTLFIAEGTYKPTTSDNRTLSFTIPDGAILKGAYPNGGGIRNIETYSTILSGNIDNDPTYTNNSYHVVKVKNVDNVILDGLIIREGNANIPNLFSRARGGGLFVTGSTLTLIDTEVIWNKAVYGGGLFATLSPDVSIINSTFKQNESEFGSALYHSNATNMFIRSSRIIDNNSNFRCAIEINNSLYTLIENSVIANNQATNANAIAFIATNRNQTCNVYNSTIIGGDNNKSLISLQVGNNDELGVNFYNSIIAHQDLNFDKSFVVFNNNILYLNTENCYIQGASVIGTGTNNLFSDTAGDLMLNADYSVSECSPVINAGNDLNTNNLDFDIEGEERFFSIVDIGAYEAQTACSAQREIASLNTLENTDYNIYPNPASSTIFVKTEIEEIHILIYDAQGGLIINTRDREIDINHLSKGIYLLNIIQNGEVVGSEKVLKM